MVSCIAPMLVVLAVPALVAGDFRVKFNVETTEGLGSFVILVHEDWAPIGAAHFKKLVEKKHYDDVRFFRVIPTFMVQFGISGNPEVSKVASKDTIMDEKVIQSNKPGFVTFAKTGAPNSRSTQLFINYADNGRLDGMGFAPFGEVEGDGMAVVKQIYNVGEKPNQGQIQARGNEYLNKDFPELSKIIQARIVGDNEEL